MTSPLVKELLLSPVAGHEGQCQVCYSDLEYKAITPCGHDSVCAICHVRLRFLHSDTKCPMCKTPNPQIVVDASSTSKIFEDYHVWGQELGADFLFDENVGMFFPVDYYPQEIQPLFGYHCTECNDFDGTTPDPNIYEQQQASQKRKKPPTPLRALQDHLRNAHRLTLCQLCVTFKRAFVSQLPRFTPSQLKHHLSNGDGPESGFNGHPLCEFCRPTRFYDIEKLHHHLQTEHYKCHVCDKQGIPNQFFRNYQSLEHHFDAQHFLCRDVQCLAARFVVFENEIDLRGHEIEVHGGTSTGSTKIQLEFKIRRAGHDGSGRSPQQQVPSAQDFQYGLDGQAFCPEGLDENDHANDAGAPTEATSHPMHLQRTNELRAHAAQVRQSLQQEDEQEAFPTLGSAGTASLNVGWSSERLQSTQRTNRAEDFPSLPAASSSQASKKPAAAKLKSNRQFAAMRSAASTPASTSWRGSSAVAAAAAPPRASHVDNFPSLGSSTSAAAVAPRTNRQVDLHPDNFPSLGGTTTASSAPRYAAAESLARKPPPPSLESADNFPSLGGTTTTSSAPRYVAAENLARKPPSLKSHSDFPPAATAKKSVRESVLGQKKPPALDNVLQFPPPPANKDAAVTLQEIKTTLGSVKYKKLKQLTKEFATDALVPEAYVDHAAALFERGYADADFWSFMPSLLASCPNEMSAKSARLYMERLRMNQAESNKPTSQAATSGWSAASTSNASDSGWATVGAAAAASGTAMRPASRPVASLSSVRTVPIPTTAKTKDAWAGGGQSTVVRAKQKPGSVMVAAAQEQTAVKQSKKSATSKKSKKKQNDEIRALAFGS